VRAGMLMVDSAPLAIWPASRSGRRTATPSATRARIAALSAWRNHDFTAARRYLDMITNDAESPPGTRARADVLRR